MGASVRELSQRIRGVANIQKITRAMEMVATTRLRRFQSRAEGSRPYADAIRAFSALLAGSGGEGEAEQKTVSPLTEVRDEVKSIGALVISSDRGLCGAFNANLLRKADYFAKEHEKQNPQLTLLGKKARQHFSHREAECSAYDDVVEKVGFRRAKEIATDLTKQFVNGEVDEVWLVYTRFVSMGRQVPTVERLLPIAADAEADEQDDAAEKFPEDILFEPSREELYELLLPKSIEVRVYAAILDSLASEFAARRAAMKAATDAASDMITDLRRIYNRARQESITGELLDIVGGAEALA